MMVKEYMKTIIVTVLLILSFNIASADRFKNARQEMLQPARLDLVQILIADQNELEKLDRLGVIINQVQDGYCVAEASPNLIAQLKRQRYQITTLEENISNIYYENFFTESDKGRYLTYTEFIDTMHVIAVNNPTFCKLETLGLSHQNRLVLAMKISDSAALDQTEPALYFDGAIHGDEKIAWAVCFEFIKYIVLNYYDNVIVNQLVNNREIWVVPMINPDGYVASSRYNSRTVDLNRNYGWMWGNESYCGASVFSENEANLFYNLFWRQPFVIYTSYHAGTLYISNPWSYTIYDSIPEKFNIWHLSQGYSQRGNNYPYGQSSIGMYPINGSSKDFAYGMQGDVSWSIELHNLKTPPAATIDTVFNVNREAMLYLARKAGQGIRGLVTDSITNEPLHAQIWFMPRNWLTYTSQTKGDFHKFYLPGNYTVITRCPGYKDETLSVVVPNLGDSSVFLNIKMTPNANAVCNYGMRVVATNFVTTSTNRTYPLRALGERDSIAYQIDNTKWIVLEMAKPIQNSMGSDFTVFRSAGSGSATVKVSNNWKGPWSTIGIANQARTHFDLASVALDTVRYVRLEASSAFSLDAIQTYVSVSSTEEQATQKKINDFKLKSNIVNSDLKILYSGLVEQILTISIYDINGRCVRNLKIIQADNEFVYDLKDNQGKKLKNGVYFVKTEGLNSSTQRFCIIR